MLLFYGMELNSLLTYLHVLDVFKNWVATTRNCQELAILV